MPDEAEDLILSVIEEHQVLDLGLATKIAARLREAGYTLDISPCAAELRHGPGHQSRTRCELTGPHEVHRVVYRKGEATWEGDYAYTGAFDEPPMVD